MPERWRFASDRDRREAQYGRRPAQYHFDDEQPEREAGGHDEHRHPVDGYCDHYECKGWRQAD